MSWSISITSADKASFAQRLLFGVPFCLAGLWALSRAWQGYSGGAAQSTWVPIGVFGLIFLAVGIGPTVRARFAGRDSAGLRQTHPDEPWYWHQEWIDGRITGSSSTSPTSPWLLAIVAVSFAAITASAVWGEVREGAIGVTLGLFAVLVPAIVLLTLAIRRTLQQRRFGTSTFVPDRIPGVIGGELSGRIETTFQPPHDAVIQVALSNLRRITTDTRENRKRTEHVLWRDETTVRNVSPTMAGVSFPVRFEIPYECDSTEPGGSEDRTLWRLTASSELPGVDYEMHFEVPVFRTADSSEDVTDARSIEEAAAVSDPRPDNPTITFEPTAKGGVGFRIGPGSNPAGTLIFTAFTGAFALAWFFAGGILFGVIVIFLVYATLWAWLGVRAFRVESGDVVVAYTALGWGPTKVFRCSEIQSVRVRGSGTSGSGVFYDVVLSTSEKPVATLGLQLDSKEEAEWLRGEIARAIERWQ